MTIYEKIGKAIDDALEPFDAPFVVRIQQRHLQVSLFGWAIANVIIVRKAEIRVNGREITDEFDFKQIPLYKVERARLVYRPDYSAVTRSGWSQGRLKNIGKKYLDTEIYTKNIKNGKVQF